MATLSKPGSGQIKAGGKDKPRGVLEWERVQKSIGVKIPELWGIKMIKVPVFPTIVIRPLILLMHLHLRPHSLYSIRAFPIPSTRSLSRIREWDCGQICLSAKVVL